MSKTKIDVNEHIAGLYGGTQMTVYEEALQTIELIGDSNSRALACEALTLAGMIERGLASKLAAKVKKEDKAEPKAKVRKPAKAKAKAKVKAKSKPKKAPKKTGRDSVTVTVVPQPSLNGSDDSSQRFLTWRKSEALSQKAAAAKAEVSISAWQAWETGKWDPSPEMMRRLESIGI